MSLKNRYKTYLLLAILFCALGITLNLTTGNTTGIGALVISTGGISLALGVTIKRKANANNTPDNNDLTSQ